MKNLCVIGCAFLALTACAPTVPESGVGFNDYGQYELDRARREAELNGTAQSLPSAPAVGATSLGPATGQTTATGGTPLPYTLPESGGVDASPSNAAPVLADNPGLSDEQDFSAVAGRETIESDAERRAQQAQQYQVVEATDLPTRHGAAGPNIVDYALNAPNVKGQEWYSRFKYSGQGRFQRNCAKYTSPDEAQRDFLARGGPERDPRGIDPDGDGFACGWDPAPFLLARQAGQGN